MRLRYEILSFLLLCCCCWCGLVSPVMAQNASTTHVWIGGSGGSWTTGSNWDTGAFTDTNGNGPFRILVFRNENSQTVNNDMNLDSGGFNTDDITFEEGAGAYILTGKTLDMLGAQPTRVDTADITNLSTNTQTINLNLIARPDFTTALIFNTAAGDIIVNGIISTGGTGTPVIRKIGDYTLELNGDNSYTGKTEILGGTLKVNKLANATSASPIGRAPDTSPDYLLLDGGTLHYTGESNASTNRGFTLGANGGTLKTNSGVQVTFSGNITDAIIDDVTGEVASGDLTISEGSTIALTSTTSDFTGAILIKKDAVLRINNLDNLTSTTSPLGTATDDPSKIQLDGGTLEFYSSSTRATAHGLTLLDLGGTVLISNAGGGIRMTGKVTGGGTLDVKGLGYLALTNNTNDYAGITTVHEGAKLEIRQANALGEADADSYTLVKSGATLEFNPGGVGGPTSAALSIAEFITVESGGTIRNASRSNSLTNTITLLGDGDITFAISSTLTLSNGKLSGSGNLLKTGTGTLVLGNSNTGFSGQITVAEGILRVGNFNALGTETKNLILNGGTFRYSGSAAALNNGITLEANGGTLDVTNAWRAAGKITGAGPLAITGSTYVAFSNNTNDYTGVTTINSGASIYLRNDNVLGATGSDSATKVYGTVAFDPANSGGPTSSSLTVNETFQFYDGSTVENLNRDNTLTGPVEFADGTTQGRVADNSTLTLATGITGNGGFLLDNSDSSNSSLNGRVIFTGTNTYAGPTTLNNGVFQVGKGGNGSIASVTTVHAPATLSGSGSILEQTDLSGILSPGDNGGANIGTLTIKDLALKDGATLLFKFVAADAFISDISELETLVDPTQSGANDFVQVTNVLSADADAVIHLQLDFTSLILTEGMIFDLIDADSFAFSGDPTYHITVIGGNPDYTINTSRFADSGIIAITAVPEPSRALLLLTGLSFGTLRRRRPTKMKPTIMN